MKNELRDNGLIDKKLGQIIHKYLFENNKKEWLIFIEVLRTIYPI